MLGIRFLRGFQGDHGMMSTSNDDDHRMIIVMLKTYIDLTVMRHANQMRNSL